MPELTVCADNSEELIAYLRGCGFLAPNEAPAVEELRGGVSSRIVLVRRKQAHNLVVKQALAKLRVAVEWRCDPNRILREAEGMRILAEVCPAGSIVPLVHTDPAQHLIVMAEVPEPHVPWKQLLLAGEIRSRHFEQAAELLAALHVRYWGRAEEVPESCHDCRYFEALRLEPYYLYAAEQVPQARGFLDELVEETRYSKVALAHGDFSPKNLLVAADRLILLDHEVIHFGDPAFDVGFLLAHLLSKAHHLSERRGELIAGSLLFVEHYRAVLGPVEGNEQAEQRVIRHTLACLLARVAGRSTLEYLDTEELARQRDLVLDLMGSRLPEISELIGKFGEKLNGDCRRA